MLNANGNYKTQEAQIVSAVLKDFFTSQKTFGRQSGLIGLISKRKMNRSLTFWNGYIDQPKATEYENNGIVAVQIVVSR